MDNEVLPSFSIGQLREMAGIDAENCIGDDFMMFDKATRDFRLFEDPCRIDALAVILCMSGRIRCRINLTEYEVTEGMVVVSMPMNIVQVDSGQADECREDFTLRGFILSTRFLKDIHIDMKNIIPLYMQIQNESCMRMQKEDIGLLGRYYELLGETLGRRTPHTNEIARGLIAAMIHAFCDVLWTNASESVAMHESAKSRRKMFFEQFMALLDQYHCSQRSLKFYADRLYITPKYLSAVIKEVSGRSAAEWVDDFVILEAKTLLKFSDLSIQEIAYRLNFSTQSFFGKYFKHQTGMSPSDYKIR